MKEKQYINLIKERKKEKRNKNKKNHGLLRTRGKINPI